MSHALCCHGCLDSPMLIKNFACRLCSGNEKVGDGSSQESAGQTCNTIRKYWLSGRNVKSSVRWINPSPVYDIILTSFFQK